MNRREFLSSAAAALVPATPPVKAFCIDFNWADGKAAEPGTYAHADPEKHVRWYQELGANTIQTFCVSYNGYAWYPSEVAPVTPGLAHPNFLGDMVRLGHRERMKVMGYYCLGANPYWERRHAAAVHGEESDYIKIPLTLEYLDYFCDSVRDTLRKVEIDGFMVDWVRPPQHKIWLACEKEMYRTLLGEAFPASGAPSAAAALEFDRRAILRAWRQLSATVRETRPVIIWTNHPFLREERALWEGHPLLQEVPWVLNESPEVEWLEWLRKRTGPKTLIVQNLCGWDDHDAGLWRRIDTSTYGLYGYAKADAKTTLPDTSMASNVKNIAQLREAYHRL